MSDEMMNQYDDSGSGNSLKGYKIVVIILTVIIAALSFQYYRQVNKLRGSEADLMVERDTLQNRLSAIAFDLSNLKTENDTINQNLIIERHKADSLLNKLKQERSWSYAKIKQYERELGTMRTVMQGYIHQIDSLNQLNIALSNENIQVKKELASTRLRAETAEEGRQELQALVRKGAVVTARDIDLKALNARDQQVQRARRATRLRVDLILNANPMASVGERSIYVRIIGPGRMVLASSSNALFEFEGEKITYSAMRSDVDYQGEALPVSLYYSGDAITEGKYNVEIYMDGYRIGTNEIILK